MTDRVFYSGVNNYKKHTHSVGTSIHKFTTDIVDVDTEEFSNFNSIIARDLGSRGNKTVEVLYSGGIDSELVLTSCLQQSIPCHAVTMRLLSNNCALNTHDLYYSERFCRMHGIDQSIVDLDCDSFFENGDFVEYVQPYLINEAHVATHLWLLERCSSFRVLGGDYPLPWLHVEPRVVSPFRHHYCYYDEYMKDRGISGIGNMLSHSLEMAVMCLDQHVKLAESNGELYNGDLKRITRLKVDLYSGLVGQPFEQRLRSYGWDRVPVDVFNIMLYSGQLYSKFGTTTSGIAWGQKLAAAIKSVPGSNNKFN